MAPCPASNSVASLCAFAAPWLRLMLSPGNSSIVRYFGVLLACALVVTASAQSYTFTTLAGEAGKSGLADGVGSEARFSEIDAIAVDANGTVFVTDTDASALRKISPAGVVTTFQRRSPFEVYRPVGAAADEAGNYYFAQGTSLVWVSPTGLDTRIGVLPVDLVPWAVLPRPGGTLYYSDGYKRVVRRLPSGAITVFGGDAYGAADGVEGAASFFSPTGLVADRTGNVYVADASNHTIRKISPEGMVTTVAGRARLAGAADGVGVSAQFSSPRAVAVDGSGNLLVADTNNHTLRRITPAGVVSTLAGQIGQSGSVDGVGGQARFSSPRSIAVDSAGNLYVATLHTVRKGVPTAAPAPPILLTRLEEQSHGAILGASASFTVAATGTEPFTYQWARNGVALPGASRATLEIATVSAADEGSYTVTVSNGGGAITSAAARLNVTAPTLTSFVSRRSQLGGSFLWGIATGNGTLVAVGTGGTILSSPDGRVWTRQNSGTSEWLVAVAFGAGQFVAVGDHGTILTSPDGATWQPAKSPRVSARLNNVIYAPGGFVAVGEGSVFTASRDGQTWSQGLIHPYSNIPATGWLRGLAYAAGPLPFFATGQGGAGFIVFNGDLFGGNLAPGYLGVWSGSQLVNFDLEATVAVFGSERDSLFVSIGEDGRVLAREVAKRRVRIYDTGKIKSVYYEFDQTTFKDIPARTGIPGVRLRGLVQGAGALFATGENGVILGAPGYAGPWAAIPSGTTANLVNGVFVGNSLFVVGENETILQSTPIFQSRLMNVSTRGVVGLDPRTQAVGGRPMISGLVIAGKSPKRVLLRAIGPTLAAFGAQGTLATPVLTLFNSRGEIVATNSGWATAANAAEISAVTAQVGAFALRADRDSALLVTLEPDAYTASVSGAGSDSGLALLEAYDADPIADERSRAINLSTRGNVGTGAQKLITGFVVGGTATRRMLIRAVGPSLSAFGVEGVLAEPQIEIYNSRGLLEQTIGAWSAQANAAELQATAEIVGAFPLDEGSKDAAVIVTLAPGAWTVQVSGRNETTGAALVEVYDLP